MLLPCILLRNLFPPCDARLFGKLIFVNFYHDHLEIKAIPPLSPELEAIQFRRCLRSSLTLCCCSTNSPNNTDELEDEDEKMAIRQ